MHIVCPHCTTSYAINPASLGAAGRTVSCSRCKEVWLARPQDALAAVAPKPAMAEAGAGGSEVDAAAEWEALAGQEAGQQTGKQAPVIDSPSIAGDWSTAANDDEEDDWPSLARHEGQELAKIIAGLVGFLVHLPISGHYFFSHE